MSETGETSGTQLGPYTLDHLRGRGGMGEVYQAVDTRKDRVVALKVLTPQLADDSAFRERFLRESQIAARLNDPHVVPIHDFGEIDGRLFLDMRLVAGDDLRAALRSTGPLPARRAVHIVEQVASALDSAHRSGLVHRDVKPDNILLADDDFAYLVDFGLAQAVGDSRLTSTGSAVGSFGYMAPERFGAAGVGPAADVYALTCVLFECLSGTQPFSATSIEQLIGAHLHQPPPLLHNAFDAVIAKGMAKNPDDRYPSAGALAHAARAALDGTVVSAALDGTVVSAPTLAPLAGNHPAYHQTMVGTPSSPSYPGPTPYPPAPPARQEKRSVLQLAMGALIAVLLVVLAGTVWAFTRTSEDTATTTAASTTPNVGPLTTGDVTTTVTAVSTPLAPTTPPPTYPTPTTTEAPSRGSGDLGLSTPITRPDCDGSYAAFVYNATSPGQYASEIATALANNPGASYLRTDQSCSSLRQSLNGNPIYAVYYPGTLATVCATKARIGGETYARRLDNATAVGVEVC